MEKLKRQYKLKLVSNDQAAQDSIMDSLRLAMILEERLRNDEVAAERDSTTFMPALSPEMNKQRRNLEEYKASLTIGCQKHGIPADKLGTVMQRNQDLKDTVDIVMPWTHAASHSRNLIRNLTHGASQKRSLFGDLRDMDQALVGIVEKFRRANLALAGGDS